MRLTLLSSLLMPVCSSSSSASASSSHAFTSTGINLALPDHFTLKRVVLFTRHGDRAQISRVLGPDYPESDHITNAWSTRLPGLDKLEKLSNSAKFHHDQTVRANMGVHEEDEHYTGWDHVNRPYGMLTDIGSQQLIDVGQMLGQRYSSLLRNTHESAFYCRSTNMCR